MKGIVFNVETNKDVDIDLDEIIKSRALLQANSGGGKSHIIRKICEKSHGKYQLIILDPEGEFHTLREKYEFILIGKSTDELQTDIELDVKHAPLLAKKLMETGANAIIDLFEMSKFERRKFVKAFLDSMVDLPKKYWHKCFVILDEAHVFAPEKDRSESLESVADLASRGRKRRYALICATQRISKFNKDVAAELNTKLIGRCSLDVDRKRAAEELGLGDSKVLRSLKHEFFAFGPAISDEIIKIKAHDTETKSEDPDDIGKYEIKDVGKMLKHFEELPKEAENKLRNEADLRKKINEQELELRKLRRQKPQIDPQKLQIYHDNGYSKGFQAAEKEYKSLYNKRMKLFDKLTGLLSKVHVMCDPTKFVSGNDKIDIKPKIPNPSRVGLNEKYVKPAINIENSPMDVELRDPNLRKYAAQEHKKFLNEMIEDDIKLGRCEKSILETLAKFDEPCSRAKVGVFAGYSYKSGSFSNSTSKLKTNELIDYQDTDLIITDKGRQFIGEVDPLPATKEEIIEFWKRKTGRCAGLILEYLANNYPNVSSKEEVGDETGYSSGSGSFSNSVSKLHTLGLIEYKDSGIKASDEIFANI